MSIFKSMTESGRNWILCNLPSARRTKHSATKAV